MKTDKELYQEMKERNPDIPSESINALIFIQKALEPFVGKNLSEIPEGILAEVCEESYFKYMPYPSYIEMTVTITSNGIEIKAKE